MPDAGEDRALENGDEGRRSRIWFRSTARFPARPFPGRAAILIKLLDIDADSISAVYEKPGSMKIGHYLPGTRIPIKSDDDLFALPEKPPIMLNLAWHISREINEYLRSHGYTGEIVDIFNPQEF